MADQSPYKGKPRPEWAEITRRLVVAHPLLGSKNLLEAIDRAWAALWQTTIGHKDLVIPLCDLSPRAQIVGDFFESILALLLSTQGQWQRGTSKEKDLIYIGSDHAKGVMDCEIKTSGQATGKIYGNRSYAQPGGDGSVDSPARKKRSGYYMCINFYEQVIYQVRVGWIDPMDWEPQKAPTGQMAGLRDYVYEFKLLALPGPYYLGAPLFVLTGVGPKASAAMAAAGVRSVGDLASLLLAREGGGSVVAAEATEAAIAAAAINGGVAPRVAGAVARAAARSTYFAEATKLAREGAG